MGLGGLLLLAALVPAAAPAEQPLDVRYDDGRLTVRIESAPLDRVLEAVGAETGIEFRGELRDWREVNKRFDAVPLPEALGRLLGRQNFILRYDAAGEPALVELRGAPQPRSAARVAGTPPANVGRLLTTAPPVPLPPVLRDALRTETARPTRLFLAGVREGTEAVRVAARRAFLDAVEANRPLRDALGRADPAALVPLIRSLPADRVDELLADLGRRSRDPVLRGFFLRTRTHLQQERAARAAEPRG